MSTRKKLFYGWIIVIAWIAIGTITFGTRQSFGVFFKSLESEFDLGRAATSGVFSIYMALSSCAGLLGGWAADRFKPRTVIALMGFFVGISLLLTSRINSVWQLYVTYSLLLALGTGSIFTVSMAVTARWFDRRRGLAMGLAGLGVGLGTIVMAPLATYLVTSRDWRFAFLVMGLVALGVIIPFALLIKREPADMGLLADGADAPAERLAGDKENRLAPAASITLAQALRTQAFWFLELAWFFLSFCWYMVLTHIVPHATDIKISPVEAAAVLALMGGCSIPGRLVMGAFADRAGRRKAAVSSALLQVAAMVWLLWAEETWSLYLFAVVFGFGFGGVDTAAPAMMGDLFGVRHIGAIMGALVLGWGMGAALGPAVAGFLFDTTGSYFTAFLIAGLVMAVATLFLSQARRVQGS